MISAFYDVYNTLGYGFLEHVYSAALERELVARGREVVREMAVGCQDSDRRLLPRPRGTPELQILRNLNTRIAAESAGGRG